MSYVDADEAGLNRLSHNRLSSSSDVVTRWISDQASDKTFFWKKSEKSVSLKKISSYYSLMNIKLR